MREQEGRAGRGRTEDTEEKLNSGERGDMWERILGKTLTVLIGLEIFVNEV